MIQHVISTLNKDGFPITEFVPDSILHRFSLDSEDRKKSGFYIGFRNFHVTTGEEYFFVTYGSWRDGLDNLRRFSTLTGGLTAVETKLQNEQIKKAQKQAEKFKEELQLAAAEEAEKKWNFLSSVGHSDYLERKHLTGIELGVRFDTFNGDIYVPARDEYGKLWSFERIKRDGSKLSHPGGRKQGCFHVIGSGNRIYFAEGLATAASIHAATNAKVVCTFGSSGLKRTATTFRKLYPDGEFIICGDLDREGSNASTTAARQAGESVACSFVYPVFTTGTGKDFNDLHVTEGIDAVRNQLIQENLPATTYSPVEGIFPDEDEKGKRLGTLKNVKELLRRLNVTVRYNVISKNTDINIPGVVSSLDNREIVNHTLIADDCVRAKVPIERLSSHIKALSDQNQYNPVASWIESEEWDGVSRLQSFYDTIHAPQTHIKELLMRKWLFSAIAALYVPDGVYSSVLVLQGKQYTGKTQWFKNLVPKSSGISVLAEGVTLRPDDKDSVYHCISHWIVELGELDATFRKADIAQLKSFLSKTTDEIRLPYAEKSNTFARRTVFFASVNEKEFLHDTTGNRRFWTIECDSIDFNHSINMQQLWAEVRSLYLENIQDDYLYKLTKQENELLNEHNEKFQAIDPIQEMINDYFAWDLPENLVVRIDMNVTEVCKKIGYDKPTKKETNPAANILRKLTGGEPNRMKKYSMPLARS